jgi:glycosyltransferase involved in cell wall biosynthesis
MSKHILLSTHDPGVGGVAYYNNLLVKGLLKSGYQVTCVQPVETDYIKENLNSVQKINFISFNQEGWESNFRAIASEIDLVICSNTNPFSNLKVQYLAIELGVPYIVIEGLVEAELSEQFSDYLRYLMNAYDKAKYVIAVSQHNLDLLHQSFGLAKQKGQVIHYGIPRERFSPRNLETRSRLLTELGIPDNALVCFTAARIEYRKGYQYQLEAIKQLMHSKVWEQIYFIWAGGGIFQPQFEVELKSEISQLGIENKVIFLGQIPNVDQWLNVADIFILPSQQEGMPISIIEAMAKGIPVIATAVSGIPEELEDTGILISDPNIDSSVMISELVKSLEELVVKPELRQVLGQKARQRAEILFKEERMLQETLSIIEEVIFPTSDYISPDLEVVIPDDCFPNMVIGNPNTCQWPYLRREIPHNWYVDERHPFIGFLSRDEASILYNTALKFQGKRALEIGCWMGWSACHIAIAGVELDVVDPILEQPVAYESVSDSLRAAGVLDSVNLIAGYSPAAVETLALEQNRKWPLIFIDGNHQSPGPLQDAMICEGLAEEDAMILFHDLASPDVSEGLDYLRDRGWNTIIYQTMQIMGVAWRGNVEPVKHQPDPSINWEIPPHLRGYNVSGIDFQNQVQSILTQELNMVMDLTYLANKYGSDKGDMVGCKHGYAQYYEFLFSNFREKEINFLELGLLVGDADPCEEWRYRDTVNPPSVSMWKEYFPNSHIYGFDISDFSGFEDNRFTFIQGDLGKEDDYQKILTACDSFDIIIDDGSHASYHQLLAFLRLFDALKPGGYYIVEDLHWQPQDYENSLPAVPLAYNFFFHYIQNGNFLPTETFNHYNLKRLSDLVESMYFMYQTLYDQSGVPIRKVPKLCVIKKKEYPLTSDNLRTETLAHNKNVKSASYFTPKSLNNGIRDKHSITQNPKVTFCTCDDPNFTGGPNIWLRRLLPALNKAGLDVNLLCFVTTNEPESCPTYSYLQQQGIHCRAFGWQTSTEQKVDWLLSELNQNLPDIFVPNMLVAAFYASRWVREAGIPTVGILHSDDDFHREVLKNFVMGAKNYQFSALVSVSRFLEEYTEESLKTSKHSALTSEIIFKRIPYGVPIPGQKVQSSEKRLKLLYVGRLEEEQKQISAVTHALCQLTRKVSEVEVLIVGEGSARANVEKILAEEGENLPIRLGGLVENSKIQALMLEHHAFVLLSSYEGLPIALMEAMACGLVPICLNMQSGIPELVEDGVTGIVVNNREDEFIHAVQRLGEQPQLWEKLSLAARAKIEHGYSVQLSNSQWLDFLRDLHQKSGSRQEIYKPRLLNLPPIIPAFAREDCRQTNGVSFTIIIDAIFFQFYPTGIARVWRSLLEEWSQTKLSKYILVLDREGTAPKIPGIRYRSIPCYSFEDPVADRTLLQKVCNEENADLFISSYYTIPETTPSVFMAYDMIPEVLRDELPQQLMQQEKYQAIEHATAYLSISASTARDLCQFFPDVATKPITVAHCGVSSQLGIAIPIEIDNFRKKYALQKPYFLLVGTGFTQANLYKNSILFFQAFAKLENSESFDIICTGGSTLDPELAAHVNDSTIHLLNIVDEELRFAYAGAVALVFPSRYEGFGMPVIEAMACGCPVITCPNSSIPEVAGDAALYVNEFDIPQMTNALIEVQDPSIRAKLIQAGHQQAQKFSWSRMANQVGNALLEATLIPLKLREINYIVCPDWSQPEELIATDLENALAMVATSSNQKQTTLLICLDGSDPEVADFLLSSAAMNLMLNSDLDISEEVEVSLVEQISDLQWQLLFPKLKYRLQLEQENKNLITDWLKNISVLEVPVH